jgi:hypothetical protein
MSKSKACNSCKNSFTINMNGMLYSILGTIKCAVKKEKKKKKKKGDYWY